jgi:hypothetical protein
MALRKAGKIVRDPSTEPTIWQMQEMELKRTGRWKEYNANCREVMEATGKTKNEIKKQVLERMGLGDHPQVVSRYREHLVELEAKAREAEQLRAMEAERVVHRENEFEEAFSRLPLDAAQTAITKWIENHRAMALREANDGEVVELTVADIEGAPSRSAVGQLRHWVNKKDEFYKNLLVAKKAGAAGSDGGQENVSVVLHDPTIAEIEAMLEAYGC